ncbi:BTB/POZ domain-containing protein KCTD17-like [Branchiostoma floridae x Branchiostoma japonicum]
MTIHPLARHDNKMASEEETATPTTSTSPECAEAGDWVRLIVGGTMFETTRTSLARLNSQFLDRLLAEDSGFSPPADGVYRIDRDPEVFRVLLNFARNGRFLLSPQVTSDMLSAAAEFYMLRQGALEAIEELGNETTSLARGWGRRYLPKELFMQHTGKEHHNGERVF